MEKVREKMSDPINREDAINAIYHHFPQMTMRECADVLHEVPSAEPERKKGRWIKMTGMMPPEYHGHYECSECQWHMKGVRSSWAKEEELTYCPNCGARMDKGEE